jgi:ATP-binding cassette subfamily B protein
VRGSALRGLPLAQLAWPADRGGEALECLARAAGRRTRAALSSTTDDIEAHAEAIGLQVDAVSERYPGAHRLVRGCPPALLSLQHEGRPHLLALCRNGHRQVQLVDPQGRTRWIPTAQIRDALVAPIEAGAAAEVTALLDAAAVPPRRRPRARRALLAERLARAPLAGGWLLRRPATTWPRALLLVLGYAIQLALLALAWQSAGSGALVGRIDGGWLAAWLLALVSAIPLQGATSWLAARLALDLGAGLRARMLGGILRLDPRHLRREGIGQLLGRALEAQALEALGTGGGLLALLALIDLAMAVLLLARGAPALLGLLGVTLVASVGAAVAYHRCRQRWTEARMTMTHELVETMVGQRTRVAQEPSARWHHREDRLLADYLHGSRPYDGLTAALATIPRLWLLAAFAGLMLPLATRRPAELDLALSLAGILVAFRALGSLCGGLAQLSGAAIAWRQVAPLLRPAPITAGVPATASSGPPVLEARQLTVREPARPEPILAGLDLTVGPGERLILEGPSGSGKSTLAQVLAGLRPADHGLILSGGLDPPTLGPARWARRVMVAPQFHDSHVLGGTLAFNLLIGRRWPPEPEDLDEAEAVCRELGLGPLLDAMPAGMQQLVGETGWQLSHGERSRIFAARAILGRADLVVLDESIAALDPATAAVVLRCVRARTRSLLLIAHP